MNQKELKHLGIIIDGNRRWARERGKKPIEGHRQGYKTLRRIIRACRDRGIDYVSIFAFSTENWERPRQEVDGIMDLARYVFKREIESLGKENIRVKVIGGEENLPKDIVSLVDKVQKKTADNNGTTLVFCFNYGGQQEIADAATKAIQKGRRHITVSDISDNLYASEVPPADLIIRTSGEQRISNFMLWRAAYSELLFFDKNWPDFSEEDLDSALADYARRQRRFGQ